MPDHTGSGDPPVPAPGVQAVGPARVFISYASEDLAASTAVCDALERAGLSCWIAPRDVVPGGSYAGEIVRAIDGARLLVLLLSKSSVESKHVLREVERASSRGHPVVGFRIDTAPISADLEYFLNTSQWLDASGVPIDRALPRLVEAVQRALAASDPAGVAAGRPSSPSQSAPVSKPAGGAPRRAVLALAVLAAAGLTYLVVDKLWLARRGPAEQSTTAVAGASSDKSIAVLPFADMSEKHDQAYFADGMAEELINRLSQAPDLKVIARTSSFQFRDRTDDVRMIAGKLSVANLIEGSIRRSGTLMRISVELVRGVDGAHLWAQSYDREERDALKVQDEIADSVAKALSVPLHLDSHNGPSMSEAYTLYLQVQDKAEHSTHTEAADRGTIEQFERVVQLDPQLGVAWAMLAKQRHAFSESYPESRDVADMRAKAREAADRAMQVAPQLAESHLVRARILAWYDWNWRDADAEMRRALELGPGNAIVQRNAFYLASVLGRWNEALKFATKATSLDPLSAESFMRVGDANMNLFAFADAETAYRHALTLSPDFPGLHAGLASALWFLGRADEARAELARETYESAVLAQQAFFEFKLGHAKEAAQAVKTFVDRYGRSRPFGVGGLYADVGQLDEAFRWFDRGISQGDSGAVNLLSLTRDPELPRIGADPRFKALVARMKLPN